MAGSALYVRSPRVVFAAMTASHSSAARSEASVPESAVPHAGNSWASAGQIVCVPSRCRYSANALRNDGRNANGPPQKSTGASMSQPCDSALRRSAPPRRGKSKRRSPPGSRFWPTGSGCPFWRKRRTARQSDECGRPAAPDGRVRRASCRAGAPSGR